MSSLSKFAYSALAAVLVASTLAAKADTYAFSFNGGGLSGSGIITVSNSPVPGVPGGYQITGITGTFTDSNANANFTGAITGLQTTSLPSGIGADGTFIPPGSQADGYGFSYDNLFYPGGSPQTASDYPFSGGFLDIYGLVFTTSSNVAVNFWSNGDLGGLTYGAGFTDGVDVLDYVGGISASAVPEPATWSMMILGVGFAGGALRRRRAGVATARLA